MNAILIYFSRMEVLSKKAGECWGSLEYVCVLANDEDDN